MGYYKRLIKRKEATTDILESPREMFHDWIEDNWQWLLLGAGAALAAVVIGYGVMYYLQVRAMDAQAMLYETAAAVPAEGATSAQADTAIAELERVAASAPGPVAAQARMKRAALLRRAGKFEAAAAEYSEAARLAGEGTLTGELAIVGQALALERADKPAQAAAPMEKLAESANFYPRQEALRSLGYLYLAAGDKAKAESAFRRLSAAGDTSLGGSADMTGTLARMESGSVTRALESLKGAAAAPEQEGVTAVHGAPPAGQGR